MLVFGKVLCQLLECAMTGSNGIRRSYNLFGVDHNFPTDRFAAFMRDIGIPGTDLAEIDAALQARFFQKKPGTNEPLERWELNEVQINCPPERIKEHLAVCGFINETKPSQQQYDYAAWPGALVTRATARLDDLYNAWESGVHWKQLIIFGGKRPLQTDKENLEACCRTLNITGTEQLHIARCWWDQLKPQTELGLMEWIYRQSLEIHEPMKDSEYPVFVDAPMKPPVKEGGPPVRPTTEDTVLEWLWSNPKRGSLLLSSGAPYGMAQDEAFWMLVEPYGITVETFGHAAPDLPIENFMREVAGCVNRIRRARKA
jgi:hypothetical protein